MERLIGIALLALGVGLTLAPVADARVIRAGSAVVFHGKLIHLDGQGRFRAWSLDDNHFDPELTAQLSGTPATHLASDGETLWAVGVSTLSAWSAEDRLWRKIAGFDRAGEELAALVVVDKSPVLVFPKRVVDPVTRRSYKVPMLDGQFRTDSLRVLATLGTETMLWVGTGHGEWGGHLVGLNLQTGKWVQFYDALHDVTGITRAKPDEVIVGWSMSHFSANTMIRTHGTDGFRKRAYPELDSKYYQKIAHSPFDSLLYGVESDSIVSIEEGNPTQIARLKGLLFEQEAHAIGVAPGISALLPVGPKRLIIVPNRGLPWSLMDGDLVRLGTP